MHSVALLLLQAVALKAAYQPEQWRFRRPVKVVEPGLVHTVRITADIQRKARADLADIRIVKQQREIPFALETLDSNQDNPATVLETVAEPALIEEPSGDRKVKLYRMDAGAGVAPYDRIRIEAGEKVFRREVEIQTSSDGRLWRRGSRATILRRQGAESLSVFTGRRQDRYLRLRVHNGDNNPLAVTKVQLQAPARIIKFVPDESGDYALVYGNPNATPPDYDLIMLLDPVQAATRIHVMAGAELANQNYAGPASGKPWTEHYRSAFYGFLTAAVAVMVFLTVRLIRQVMRSGPG
jgi:hypothetical protein